MEEINESTECHNEGTVNLHTTSVREKHECESSSSSSSSSSDEEQEEYCRGDLRLLTQTLTPDQKKFLRLYYAPEPDDDRTKRMASKLGFRKCLEAMNARLMKKCERHNIPYLHEAEMFDSNVSVLMKLFAIKEIPPCGAVSAGKRKKCG